MQFMKRGQGLSINTIVLAALALVVLVLLIFLVRNQLQKGSQKYTGIESEAEKQAKADYCESLFALHPRKCSAKNCADVANSQPLQGSWADCKGEKGTTCCQLIETQ